MNIFDETNLWIRIYGSMFIPMSWRGRPIEMLKGIFDLSTLENLFIDGLLRESWVGNYSQEK